jgi:hypothetical protein
LVFTAPHIVWKGLSLAAAAQRARPWLELAREDVNADGDLQVPGYQPEGLVVVGGEG